MKGVYIGSKDLLMSERNLSALRLRPPLFGSLLEPFRWPVTQRIVEPLTVVVLLDECLDIGAQVSDILVFLGVDSLPVLELHEAFATSAGQTIDD
jgi:hypothetical protein